MARVPPGGTRATRLIRCSFVRLSVFNDYPCSAARVNRAVPVRAQPTPIEKTPIAPWLTVAGSVTLATVFELSTEMVCAKT